MKNMRTMMRNISSVGCQKTLQWAAYGSILAAALVMLWNPPVASAQTPTTYDASATDTGTFPAAVNLGGTVAGEFIDAAGFHGYLRAPNGTITPFNPPADSTTSGTTTVVGPNSLNDLGAVVGAYTNQVTFIQTGFVRESSGSFTDIAPPGSTLTNVLISINDAGEIAGSYSDSALPHKIHGFVVVPPYAAANFTSFDMPVATTNITVASINSSGQVAGYYADSTFHNHGFLRNSTGTVTTFDAPIGFTDISVFGMNDNQEITGYYGPPLSAQGYVWQGGTITSFEANPADPQTFPQSVNFPGTVVGYDCDAYNNCNGFVRNPLGAITSLEVSGASNTQPNSVNALGTISGVWLDSSFMRHGFIETPAPVAAVPNLISLLSNPSLGLTAGEVVALSDILRLALVSINAGRNNLATLELNGFIVAVQILQGFHQISASTANTLISGAQAIVALL